MELDKAELRKGCFVAVAAARRYVDAQLSRALLICSGDGWKDASIFAPALWERAASWLTLPDEGWLARRAPGELFWEIRSARRLRAARGWAINGLVWSSYTLRVEDDLGRIIVTHSGTVREAEPEGLASYVQPACFITVQTLAEHSRSDLVLHIMTHFPPNLALQRG